ncbi:hexokinase A [Podochytrium sp. JEL0797]|nr:hexokinase A [Podochytrium sp. JEL0797]
MDKLFSLDGVTPQDKMTFLAGLGVGVTFAAVWQTLAGISAPKKKMLKRRTKRSPAIPAQPNSALLRRLHAMFDLPVEKLNMIVKQMLSDMRKGLEKDGASNIKMLPTHVTKRPTGNEKGTFLALDLGGTNFRVCEVSLDGHGVSQIRQSKFVISDACKTGPGDQLFDFIADCVETFLLQYHSGTEMENLDFKLGFTFSFPVDQVSINEGSLLIWTKGFTAEGVVGVDCVKLLKSAFDRKALNIDVTALVNDTTGTLISLAYTQPDTMAGCILGTGSNCAYVEKMENIIKYKGPRDGIKEMLINMEWGGFDDNMVVIPRTKYDLDLDRQTPRPGSYTFEQLISGMYLGEIVRLVLVDLHQTGELFASIASLNPTLLTTKDAFETAYMSRIERDHSHALSDVETVLQDLLHLPRGTTTLLDRQLVKSIVEMIGLRSARLAACGIAAVVTKMHRLSGNGVTVGVDGSLFELYPHYQSRMRDALREILGISAENIELMRAQDGSGQGAALIACLAG